ncbi:hypothetical protein ACQEVF_43875 [Nonomuraea polychroma]|uniref:hypothetical protein n=1 Tax=Nonomuraea polychroma TaxID=46176 RepID=UPI003D8BDD2D
MELIGFFADPLHLPAGVLGVLDQRASVISMFIGDPPESEAPPAVSSSGERLIAIGGDNPGIVSIGDGARKVQMRAEASGQGRVYQTRRSGP